MLRIVDGAIHIPRGEAAAFTVDITDEETGLPYELKDGEKLVLSVKKTTKDETYIIQKDAEGLQFSLYPDDTKNLAFGTYIYDIWLVPESQMSKQVKAIGDFVVEKVVY